MSNNINKIQSVEITIIIKVLTVVVVVLMV